MGNDVGFPTFRGIFSESAGWMGTYVARSEGKVRGAGHAETLGLGGLHANHAPLTQMVTKL